MIKRASIYALAGLLAVSQAMPVLAYSSQIVIHRIYYFDAAHTQHAGFTRFNCDENGVSYGIVGTSTAYFDETELGTCDDGVFNPY